MGEQGAGDISWAHYTFNLWEGCFKISPGCKHCYAESMNAWLKRGANWGVDAPRHEFKPEYYERPHKWNAAAQAAGVRQRVFCGSVMDIAEIHPVPKVAAMMARRRDQLFAMIAGTPWLDWLLLTKRPENLPAILPWMVNNNDHPPNVWLGTTAENQEYADLRLPHLRRARGAKKFVSYEPALGPIDFAAHGSGELSWLDLIIFGDESGRRRRPAELAWARSVRDQCERTGVTFHFKQWDKVSLPVLDGRQHMEMPG